MAARHGSSALAIAESSAIGDPVFTYAPATIQWRVIDPDAGSLRSELAFQRKGRAMTSRPGAMTGDARIRELLLLGQKAAQRPDSIQVRTIPPLTW
jgi:hypothetical protein